MKKLKTLLMSLVMLVILAGGTIFAGCSGKMEEFIPVTTPQPAVVDTARYVATPVNEKGYRLDYSYTDGDCDYHYVNLGKVDRVPISSSGVREYNGITPIELSYSTKSVDSGSISESLDIATSHATQTTTTYNNVFNFKAGAETSGFLKIFVKASFEAGYSHSWGGSNSVSDEITTTNTYTTFTGWAKEKEETVGFTIGNKGEPIGFYRYSVFATCDVYLTIARDRKTNAYCYDYDVFARPNTYFSGIDYSATNEFGIGEDAVRLMFNDSIIDVLPSLPYAKSWRTIYSSDWDNAPKFLSSINLAELAEQKGVRDASRIRVTFQYKNNVAFGNSVTISLKDSGSFKVASVLLIDVSTVYYTYINGVLACTGIDGLISAATIAIINIECFI